MVVKETELRDVTCWFFLDGWEIIDKLEEFVISFILRGVF